MDKKKTYKELLALKLTTEAFVIKELTAQARCDLEFQRELGVSDMNAILGFLRLKQADDRKAVLYLIDSLVKSDPKGYRELFAPHVVGIFESTWRYGNQGIRKSISKILDVWKKRNIYDVSLIRELFEKLKKLPSTPQIARVAPPVPRPPQALESSASAFDASQFEFPNFDQPSGGSARPNSYNAPQGYGGSQQGNGYGWNGQSGNGYSGGAGGGYNNNNFYNQPPQQQGQQGYGQGQWQQSGSSSYNGGGYQRQPQQYANPRQGFGGAPSGGGFDWDTALSELSGLAERMPRFKKSVELLRRHFILNAPGCETELRALVIQMKNAGVESRMLNQLMNQARVRSAVGQQSRDVDPNAPPCSFYNTPDGCRMGQKCPMRHISEEEEARRKVIVNRNNGWYSEEECVVYGPDGDVNFHTVFDEKQIKKPHRRAVSLIYGKRLSKCTLCGFRCPDRATQLHMDWHFKFNTEQANSKSDHHTQPWWSDAEAWEKHNDSKQDVDTPFQEAQPETRVQHSVPASKLYDACHICAEQLKKVFNAERDEWYYQGAMYFDGTVETVPGVEKYIVHQKCYDSRQQRIAAEEVSEATLRPEIQPSVVDILKEAFGQSDAEDDDEWQIKEDDGKTMPEPSPEAVVTKEEEKAPPKAEEPPIDDDDDELEMSDVEMTDIEDPETDAPPSPFPQVSIPPADNKRKLDEVVNANDAAPPAKRRRTEVPSDDDDEDDDDDQFFDMTPFAPRPQEDEDDEDDDGDVPIPDAATNTCNGQKTSPATETKPEDELVTLDMDAIEKALAAAESNSTKPATEVIDLEEPEAEPEPEVEEVEYWSEHEEEYDSRSEATSLEDLDELDNHFATVGDRTIYYDFDNTRRKYGFL